MTERAPKPTPSASPSHGACRRAAMGLRLVGLADLLALAVVFLPPASVRMIAAWAGFPGLPESPLLDYLVRATSLVYALHGATMLFVSFDIPRYLPLIRLLAVLAIVHGGFLLGVDLAVGMPVWWTLAEGPVFALLGVFLLLIVRGVAVSNPAERA